MKKKIIGIAVIVCLIALVLLRVFKPAEKEAVASVPAVETTKAQTGSIAVSTELTGTVEPADMAYVIPKAAGEITELYVKPGDVVSQNQKICHIDTNKMVESAKLQMQTAEVALSDANRNMSRMQALAATGDVSQQELESAQSQAQQAQLSYESAKINYNNQVEFADVEAPIAGTVESVSVSLHDNVSQTSVLCVISGQGGKDVTFYAPERIANNLNIGDPVTVTKNGTDYSGNITEVSSMVDSATGLFKVKASMADAGNIATGLTVSLEVMSEKADDALLVPTSAIYYDGGQAEIYVLEGDNTVRRKDVTVGVYNKDQSQITDGITADDEIVSTWSSELYDGAQVQKAEVETGTDSTETGSDGENTEAPDGEEETAESQ